METQIHLKTFNDYIAYFKRPEVSREKMNKIVCNSFKVIILKEGTKDEAIRSFVEFWNKWGTTRERPILEFG